MDMQQTNTQSTPSPDNRKIWRGLFTIIMIIFFWGFIGSEECSRMKRLSVTAGSMRRFGR